MKRLLPLLLLMVHHSVAAQNPRPMPPRDDHTNRPRATALRRTSPVHVDGRLDEVAWSTATPVSAFTQVEPLEGKESSQPTETRILFDDDALYVGFRMTDAGAPRGRLGRRDMPLGDSDWATVIIDSYHDHRTGFRFDLNPSGVRRDAIVLEMEDASWDPVWEGASSQDSTGWSAELRIPFSQLRFSGKANAEWGIQLQRIIGRIGESSVFAFTPRSERGGPASFGHLAGLPNIEARKPLEVLPYVLARTEHVDRGANPFRNARESEASGGVDLSLRASSSFTINATINPDFGQVEVDPAVVNLSAFETFYEEKRPFFVEGADNFAFGNAAVGPGSAYSGIFYSRRIGRTAQLAAPTPLSDAQNVSTILGAAKLSGRTPSGWTIGVLDALTQSEQARYIAPAGDTLLAVVEPRTNYFAARLNREMDAGRRIIGGAVTAVNRESDSRADRFLRSSAYAGGMDFSQEWARRTWRMSGFAAASSVHGSSAAITSTQRGSIHNYQRPDADYLTLDTAATSMTGYAGQLQVFKQAGKHVTGDVGLFAASPGYEINDLGFQPRADRIGANSRWIYDDRKPRKHVRRWQAFLVSGLDANYGRDIVGNLLQVGSLVQFPNFSNVQLQLTKSWESADDRLTRGGPLSRIPAQWAASINTATDPRRSLSLQLQSRYAEDMAGGWSERLGLSLGARPSQRWNFSVGPRFDRSYNTAQFVTSIQDSTAASTFGRRYVFADLRQTTVSIETRLNFTFSPRASFELFAQPFVSSAAFGRPKELNAPGTYSFDVYGRDRGTASAAVTPAGKTYAIDPDGTGPARAFQLPDRDFNLRSLRGNAVFRWEYRPGSTLYVAWQQNREQFAQLDNFDLERDTQALFRARPDNVLAIKLSYWLNP